ARGRRAARRPDAPRFADRRTVRDRGGDRRLRGARQGRDVPPRADHPRRGAGRPRRDRGVSVSAPHAGDARRADSRCDRASLHGPGAARGRSGCVRDQATGPGRGVPRDYAIDAHHRSPLPHGTRGLKEAMDSIRVLYVEGDPTDQELTHRHLVRHAPHIKLTVVGTVADAVERVTIGDMDVMLADYRLPDGTGLDLLDAVKSRGLEVPVVLVTGSGDADLTVRLLKAGATDYLVKRQDYLATLPVVLESAFRWFRAASERRRAPTRVLYAEHHPEDMALTLRAVQAFKLGVADYLIKRDGYLAKLPSTIENVLAQRRLADEKDGLTVLNDLAKSLITTKDLDEVLRRVVNAARELIRAEASVLWLFEAGVLWPVAWEGIEDRAAEPLRFQVTPSLAERLAIERKISLSRLLAQTGGPDPTAVLGTSGQTLAASFVGPEGLVAVLAVGSVRPREFTAIEERLLLALADHAAVAVENARLYRRLRLELEA